MSQTPESPSDFYIGWQDKAPEAYSRRSRRFVAGLAIMVLLSASLLVIFQRPFDKATFEFGTLTEVTGQLIMEPIPMLRTEKGSVLLIGYGKFGAGATLEEIEIEQGGPLEGMLLSLRGTRIYSDGKVALELTEGKDAFISMQEARPLPEVSVQNFGRVTLKGEILDPKCALGVMVPAVKKPHRSCAIRCISGGIPPLLRMTDAAGNRNYALILGENGTPINQEILPFVADQIQICGALQKQGDWLILRTNPTKDVLRLRPYGMSETLTVCGSASTAYNR